MKGGLRELLQLPEQAPSGPSGPNAEFGRSFRAGLKPLNQEMRVVASRANQADFQALSQQRVRLIEAFQKTSAQSGAADAQGRVLSAVVAVHGKASATASAAGEAQRRWQACEEDFDEALIKVGELEDAAHPKAAALRKAADAIRARAKENRLQDAAAAFELFNPKLLQLYTAAFGEDDGKQPDGLQPGGAAESLGEGDSQTLLQEILKLAAQQAGIDLGEIKDLKDLPAEVIKNAMDIVKLVGGGGLPDVLTDEAKALLTKLIDLLKNFIAKRRVKQYCVVTLVNNTDETLKLGNDWKFIRNRGAWSSGKTPPPTIAPRSIVDFQAESPDNMKVRGVDAEMSYNAEGLSWKLAFANPRDKPIDASAAAEGKRAAAFDAARPMLSGGDTAEFRFELRLVKDPNPKEPKRPGGDNGGGDNGGGKGGGETPTGVDRQASCLISVVNNTASVLTLVDQGHERGDFMTFPDQSVQPGAKTSFVSVETPENADQGCKGFAVWQLGDDGQSTWRIDWDNPEQEKNTADSAFSGALASLYHRLEQIGQGDENVPVTFTVSDGGAPVDPTEEVTVSVAVVDSQTDGPIEGARVDFSDQSQQTNASGEAVFTVPPGVHSWKATADGYGADSGDEDVTQGEMLFIALTPTAPSGPREALTIMVRDKESGQPIEGAAVSVGDQTDTTSALGLASAKLPAGKHKFEATHNEHNPERGTVEVVEGDNAELVIEMTRDDGGAREGLTIVVRNKQTGDPIEGAEVTAGDQTDTTSSIGLATVELPVGPHPYGVTAEGYTGKNGEVEIVEGDNPELLVELEPDGACSHASLVVAVVDDDTSAVIAGAAVTVGGKSEQTSAAGLAVLTLDQPGSYDYQVSADGYPTPATGTVEVHAGDDNELVVRLNKDSAQAFVNFHVTDKQTREPIADADVTLGPHSGKTNAQGVCEFRPEPGELPYTVHKEGYADASGSVVAEQGAQTDAMVELEKLPEFVPPTEANEPTLRKGDESVDGWVEYLQKLLNHHLGAGTVGEHGKFDQQTYDAVKKFQEKTKCQKDGIVGNETWSALRSDPERAPVGVDDKPDEQGAEGRWAKENSDFVTYDAARDELAMKVVSVGDQPIDDFAADIFVNGKRLSPIKLGAPTEASSTGSGHTHTVLLKAFAATHGAAPYDIDAYLPQDLGGDLWTAKGFDPAGGGGGGGGGGNGGKGKGGGGKGGGGKGKGGGTTPAAGPLNVIVQDDKENPIEGAIVSLSPDVRAAKTTDANGEAVFADVPAGEYQIDAVSPDGAMSRTLKADHTADGGDGAWYIRLGERYTAKLQVVVTDSNEADVPGVAVKVSAGSKVLHQGKTGADGSVTLELTADEIEQDVVVTGEKDRVATDAYTVPRGDLEPYGVLLVVLQLPNASPK